MNRKLNLDDEFVENKSLYKKVNDIKREREEEKKKDLINRRKSSIITFFMILVLIGLINFYSSVSRFDNAKVLDKMTKQLLILIISVVIFMIMSSFKFGNIVYDKMISKKAFRIFVLISGVIIFLVIAYIPNDTLFPTINGGKGWVHIGPVSIQIPELFKVPFIISLASILARGKDDNKKISYSGNLKSVIMYTVVFSFVITYCLKDMGTAIHYIMIASFLVFLSDIPNKIIYPTCVAVIFLIPTILIWVLNHSTGYKQHRVKVFLDGILHGIYNREDAYQIYQSLLAFGTGGMLGKGYGNGVQKYNYIPEVETDFAIATFAEEMGFVGMLLVLISFFILFLLIMNVADNSKNYFSKYLVAGIAGYFITQVIINIGVAIGLIPVFGIPLPFISSGGSSLLALSLAMGLVIYANNTQTIK